mgnify:FL=1
MLQNRYQAYKQQSMLTMTQGEMLTAVYDGLLKAIYSAQKAFETRDLPEINKHLLKAQEILGYLKSTLNSQYEIAQNLESLYDYFIQQLRQANVKKSPEGLQDVAQMIQELRDAFVQADKNVRSQK